MYGIDCIDETFDPNFTTEYILSIQFGLDGFSFCILDDIRKKHLVFKHFSFLLSNYSFLLKEIKEICSKDEMLNKKFKKVLIGFSTSKYTIVPSQVNIQNSKEKILYLNHKKEAGEQVNLSNEESFNLNIVYAIPDKISTFLNDFFESPVIFHPIRVFTNIFSNKIKSNQNSALIAVNKKYFTIILIKNSSLQLINSFSYSNNMDFIYFLLQVFKSTNTDIAGSKIYITGEIEEESHLVEFIKKHFIHIEFLKLAKGYQYSYTFSKIPTHKFTSVINPEG